MFSVKCPVGPVSDSLRLGIAVLCVFATASGRLLAQQADAPGETQSLIFFSLPANEPEPASSSNSPVSPPVAILPDAPQPLNILTHAEASSNPDPDPHRDPVPATRLAPVFHRYIEPGEAARRLTPGQQFLFGLVQPISPYFLLTISAAAGYEQAVDGAPNYGSNIGAYGQRVGAAAARNASQSFFSYSVMAPIFHEDVRYYIMGKRRSVITRAAYAASRAVVTRDVDDGHATPNYAEISGYAEAAALSNAYYPPVNRTFGRTTKSFGVSLGGLALSNVVREFLPGLLRAAHLEKLE